MIAVMLQLRPAVPGDVPAILALIRELAEYEKQPGEVVATEADLLRDGFGPEPRYSCTMALWDGEVAGFAFWFHNYSTWTGRPGIFLEDLFVRPRFRSRGIGRALLVELARVAVARGCARMNWHVLDWNEPAFKFYDTLGARRLTEWEIMRLDGPALERLARDG
jgi:GNAT superfamily N-acetyltransferase